MSNKTPNLNKFLASAVAVGSLFGASAQAAIVFTFENASVQATSVSGVLTETFDTGVPGTAIGTYTNATVIAGDVFGGAQGTSYLTLLNSGSSVTTLDLNSPQKYFGMWWSAGDANDLVSFYDGATLVDSFTVGDIIPLLTPAYYGNPNGGAFVNEPYAYLNFTATGTTSITQIQFTQVNGGGGGFETDNHSVTDRSIDPPGNSSVFLTPA